MDENLYMAAKAGNITSLDRLWQEKPYVLTGLTPYHMETVCHVALRHGREEFAWEAYSRNPILCTFKSRKGDYLLHWALKARKEDFFKKCVESEWAVSHSAADPSFLVNDEGKSLLFLAVEIGSSMAVKSLLGSSFGTNCHGPNNSTALHAAVFQPQNRHEILWNILSNFRELMNSRDGDGNTPLHHAVSSKNEYLLEILQDHNTQYISNEAGLTPIHLSASLGYLPVFERLLQLSPESIWSTTNKNQNVLHLSVEAGKVDIIEAIIQRPELRELIYEKDEDGFTMAEVGEKRTQERKEERQQKIEREQKAEQKIRMANLNALLVVDTLLITMAYSAVLNVPGGFDDKGTPNLIGSRRFLIFVKMNTFVFTSSALALYSTILSIFLNQKIHTVPGLYRAALVFPVASFLTLALAYSFGLLAMLGHHLKSVIEQYFYIVAIYCLMSFLLGITESELKKCCWLERLTKGRLVRHLISACWNKLFLVGGVIIIGFLFIQWVSDVKWLKDNKDF